MSSNSNSPDAIPSSKRKKLTGLLTTISHASSPFITVFLLTHLAAPVLANLGGTALASQTMILGREYYQTTFGERYLVLGPIAIHAIAGISKRLLLLRPSSQQQQQDKNAELQIPQQRPLKSYLSITAYSTALILLPIHFLINRSYPSIPTIPISSVGPSSLDYEYVKFGLQTWPFRTWFLYIYLVGCTTIHAAEGMSVIWNTWFKHRWGTVSSKRKRQVVVLGVVVVLMGMVTIAEEPLMLLSSMADRYKAAYTHSFVFRV